MNLREYKILQDIVDNLLSKQFIRYSLSLCMVPTLIVPKKDGKWRLYVDSQEINKIMVKYRSPMLRVEELIDKLQGTKLFLKIDLRSSHH